MKAAVSGGSVTAIADAPDPWGGTWGKDGSIVFTPAFNSGLVRVSANGGARRPSRSRMGGGRIRTRPYGSSGSRLVAHTTRCSFELFKRSPARNSCQLAAVINSHFARNEKCASIKEHSGLG